MHVDIIQSPSNPNFKFFKTLLSSKGVKKESRCLVSGQKIVEEVLNNKNIEIESLIYKNKMEGAFLNDGHKKFVFETELYNELDIFKSGSILAVVKLPQLPIIDLSKPPEGLEILCPLGDPNNAGALIRTATAFGTKIIMLQESANPFLPKTINASSGAVFSGTISIGPSITELSEVKDLYTLDSGGEDLSKFNWPQNIRLLVGEEGPGLNRSELNPKAVLSIPTKDIESLNGNLAASIAMYDYTKSFNN